MTGPLPRPGDTALLLLADMLDKADEEHEKRGEPTYDQTAFAHSCGTPACAIGHWMAAEGRQPPIPRAEDYARLMDVFEINVVDWAFLFGGRLPFWSGKRAARNIREFVRMRSAIKVME
jgi:hypothetical protein